MIDKRSGREARRAGASDKEKHQEGNLGQKDARLQKEKQSELSNLGEKSQESDRDRNDE
jgi:hypothetical protein